jgi:hypothetical protein
MAAWKRAGPAEAGGGVVEEAMVIGGCYSGRGLDLFDCLVWSLCRLRMEEVYERKSSLAE